MRLRTQSSKASVLTGYALHPPHWGTGTGTARAGLLQAAPHTQPTTSPGSVAGFRPTSRLTVHQRLLGYGSGRPAAHT